MHYPMSVAIFAASAWLFMRLAVCDRRLHASRLCDEAFEERACAVWPICKSVSRLHVDRMKRSELADLAAFVAVADELSFRAGAARLGITRSALSHAMQQLEKRLDVRLLNRSTRGVALTDAGRRLFESLQPAFAGIEQGLADLDIERGSPSGRLRLLISVGAAATVIAPVWRDFLATHPRVRLELELSDGPVDVVGEGFDAAIALRDFAAADMIAVKVSDPWQAVVVGAPSYLVRRGEPTMPEDLETHECIQYRLDGAPFPWPFMHEGSRRKIAVRGSVTVNSSELALRAAIGGLGLAFINDVVVEPFLRTGQLVAVLRDWSPSFDGYFLIYPGRRQVPAPLRALIDMLRTQRATIRRTTDPGMVFPGTLATV
jgi:DNA-binding transcriptional LysR family regulator